MGGYTLNFYDQANESINFDSKNNGNNLYESVKLLSIVNESIPKGIKLYSLLDKDTLYLSIENTLWILQNIENTPVEYSTSFNSNIDTFQLINDYLLIGLTGGELHLLNVLTKEMYDKHCFSKQQELFHTKYFIAIYSEDVDTRAFLVLTQQGQFYRFDIDENKKLVPELLIDLQQTLSVASYAYGKLLAIGNKTIVFNVYDKFIYTQNLNGAREFKNLYFIDECTFIGLQSNGNLALICGITLQIEELTLDKLEDFKYYCFTNKSYLCYFSQATKMIRMIEYSNDKTEIFELVTESFFEIVHTRNEDMRQMYISKHENSINLYLIQETEPTMRLQRLIRKFQFQEAEKFARDYNLSLMDINIAKVGIYIEKAACNSEEIDTMIKLMANIDDVNFILTSCLAVNCEEIESLEKILNYARTLKLNAPDDILLLNRTINRFNIYKTLMRCEDQDMTINEWSSFSNCNLLDYFQNALLNNHLESAILVFSCLNENNLKSISLEAVLRHLDNMPLDFYTAFMYTMISKSLHVIPDSLSIFIDNITNKVFWMEKYKRTEYPEAAITFVDNMLSIFHGLSDMESVPNPDNKHHIQSLAEISKCLKTILEIKNNFNFHLSLKHCMAGPSAMLHVLLSSNYFNCIEEFLIDFMTRNGIDADHILSNKINELVNKTNETYWTPLVPAIWRCIVSVETRIESLFIVLKSAKKPWCNEIREMLTIALKFTHPLVKKIQNDMTREPQYIVMDRPEYELSGKSFDCIMKDRFIIQRIIYCNLPSLIEDVYTLCPSGRNRELANLLMLQSFIEKNDFKQICKLVNNPLNEYFNVDFLIDFYKGFAVEKPELIKNFLACVEIICNKGKQKKPQYSSLLELKIINVVPSQLRSKELFAMLKDPNGRKDVLKILARDLSLNTENFKDLILTIYKYANAFGILPEQILLLISEYVNDFSFIYKAAEKISEISNDVDTMCLMATLLMKRVGTNTSDMYGTFLNDTVQTDDDGKPLDLNLHNKCLSIARTLAQKGYGLSDYSDNAFRIYKWVMTTEYITTERKELMVFPKHFPMSGTDSNVYTISIIRNVFIMFSNYLRNHSKTSDSEYITHKFDFEEEDNTSVEVVAQTMANFSKSVLINIKQNMSAAFREENHFTIYKFLFLLESELITWENNQTADVLTTLLNSCNSGLLTRVLAVKEIDERTALCLLRAYPIKKSLKIINDAIFTYKNNIAKFETIVKLGMHLDKNYKQPPSHQYESMMLAIKWWKIIENASKSMDNNTLTFKAFCLMRSKSEQIETIIKQNLVTLHQLTEFCVDYKLEKEEFYLLYLSNLLSTWKPEYEVQENILGTRRLILKSHVKELTEKCMGVVKLIGNPDAVLKCINKLWNTTNFYYYEVYITILVIGGHLNETKHMHYQAILDFLMHYERSNKPCSVETEEWFTKFIYNQPLDPLSEWRYPFSNNLFAPDIWKLLRHEINLQNYDKWFILAGILPQLKIDDICSYVVKDINFISSSKEQIEEVGYYLQPKFIHLFEKIDKCLSNITDPIIAASVAYDLIVKTPEGADQVIASKLAFKYAKKNRKSAGGEGDKMYELIFKMYYHYSLKHILHVHNLAKEEYVSLLDNPDELITALYNDERVLSFGNAFIIECPNINKAADEIGALCRIDMRAKRISMLSSWMSNKLTNSDELNQSVCLRPEMDETVDEHKDVIQRAAYMCSGDDIEFWRNHLYECFLESNGQHLYQARTLRTICMITPSQEVAARCDCTYSRALELIDELFLLHDLECLGYSWDIHRLRDIDKKRLIHKISKNMCSVANIRILLAVCNIYEIYTMEIWEKILSGLIQLNMIPEIKSCITKYTQEKITLSNAILIKAWQIVIDSTFKKLEECPKPDIRSIIMEQIHYIQTSPVINELNLSRVQNICMKLKQFEYAALLLQYSPESKRDAYLNEILLQCNKTKLIADLKTLSGFTGLHYVLKLIKE